DYLVDDPPFFNVTSANVDSEIATTAGPQLIVPSLNARFALNAANARWGSLYDALYGTDVLSGVVDANVYDSGRGELVVAYVKRFLDETVPLISGSHSEVVGWSVKNGQLF